MIRYLGVHHLYASLLVLATLIHHGHIRLIKNAKKYGDVIIGLTTDKQIRKFKGYYPELSFKFRKEILQSIIYVEQVIPSKWKIKDKFLKKNNIDVIVRGSDYKKEKFSSQFIFKNPNETERCGCGESFKV